MLTTGILSLYIHDSLTFDGTELCLNPDLFILTSDTGTSGPASVAAVDDGLISSSSTASTATSTTLMDQNNLAPSSSSSSTKSMLAVGDMVEIRVWDPLPKEATAASGSGGGITGAVLSSSATAVATTNKNSKNNNGNRSPSSSSIGTGVSSRKQFNSINKATTPVVHSSISKSAPTTPLGINSRHSVSFNVVDREIDATTTTDDDNDNNGDRGQQLGGGSSGDWRLRTASFSASASTDESNGTARAAFKQHPFQTPTKSSSSSTIALATDELPPVFPRTPLKHSSTSDLQLTSAGDESTSVSALPGVPNPPVASCVSSNTDTSLSPNHKKQTVTSRGHRRVASVPNASFHNIINNGGGGQQNQSVTNTSSKNIGHFRDVSDMTIDVLDGLSKDEHTKITPPPTPPVPPPSYCTSDSPVATTAAGLAVLAAVTSKGGSVTTATATAVDTISKINLTHRLRLSFVMKVSERTLTSFKQGNNRTQISMLRQVADLYSLSMYEMVTVHKIESSDEEEVLKAVSADFVVVTIKDQFISRGEQVLFQDKLLGSWIYEGQRLTEPTRDIKAHAREIRHGNFSAKSGIITDKTMITFRSRSARIIWLVQLSSEMWEYASPYEHPYENESVCEIYFDRWIRFLYKLFKKWKELDVTHSLTVVFFSRTFLSDGLKSTVGSRDVYGREFEDHYKTVIENETCSDWESLVVRIKEEFVKYPLEVGWNRTNRKPSSASQGNVLEAINVTLNVMQFHYLDRDLHRTGQSIVLVSPGCGVFEVDKGLAAITYQRMMDNGIGSDMLSLGLPPLHIAPFFLYNNEVQTAETKGVDANETYYEVPHWMHLSFVTYDRPEEKRLYLQGLEDDSSAPVQASSWLDSYELGPNGFAVPCFQNIDNMLGPQNKPQHTTSSSFSAAGNKAATPGKAKAVQERGQARQLITGRNFRDILEAARPRVLDSSIPSALDSILKIGDLSKRNASRLELTMTEQGKKNSSLREWGAVDFQDLPSGGGSRSSRGSSPSPSMLRLTGRSFSKTSLLDPSQSSDDGSNSSRYTDSPTSSQYGSYDRLFWEYYEAPKPPSSAFQLQRSLSLDYETFQPTLGTDSLEGEDSVSLATDAASKSSLGGDSDTESQKSKADKRVEALQQFMKKYDSMVCGSFNLTEPAPAAETSHWSDSVVLGDQVELSAASQTGAVHQSYRQARNESQRSNTGLLGEALSQYQQVMPESINAQNDNNPATMMKRRSSGGNLMLSSDSRTFSFSNERRRVASPLPTLFQQHPRDDAVYPHLLSTQFTDQPVIHRPQPKRSLINRDMSSSGLSAESPHIYSQQYTPHQSSNSFNRNTIYPSASSMTFGQYESSWQGIKPISRSPPSSSGLRNTIRSSGKLMPSSPPKLSMHRQESAPSKSLGQSPPKSVYLLTREKSAPPRETSVGSAKASLTSSRRKKAVNPFRQSDEDEVLAKRSHNRRRWSHVFPVGEVEFKRHAGPIWNSLTSPAILPLSVDFFPSPQELKDENNFQFNFYQVTLGGIDNNPYATHADLLMEMVRQRVTQDFQIVTPLAIAESEKRAAESLRIARNSGKSRSRRSSVKKAIPMVKHEVSGTIKHYLSMGHRIQVLSYNPVSDTIDILVYSRTGAQNDPMNVYDYKFLLFSNLTEKYTRSIQTFKKYADPYTWNRVDNLICGEEDRTMDIGMRFRRVMFGLIPESFSDVESEEKYVAKFKRLLEYLERLREKDGSTSTPLNINIKTSADKSKNMSNYAFRGRRDMTDSMLRFTVQLMRGKKDTFEWVEMAINQTFDTSKSYRIIFNWLVASSAKVENQITLLQRRCTQFGLKLIAFPQTTVSWNLYIHALKVPTFLCIRDKNKADCVRDVLSKLDFVYDGVTLSEPQFLDCIDDSEDYHFPTLRSGKVKNISSPQYVHRSGALFVRKLTDRQGKVILATIENPRLAAAEKKSRDIAKQLIDDLINAIAELPSENCQNTNGSMNTE